MKKILMTALLAAGLMNAGLSASGAGAAGVKAGEQAGPGDAAQIQPQPPDSTLPRVFKLESDPDDHPALAQKKAALRLFKGYGATMAQLNACRGQVPEIDKIIGGFTSRNGNTLATVMAVIKRQGGITPEIKNVLNSAITEEAAKAGACQALVRAVADGERDIYKAPAYLDDYRLVRSR